MADFEYNKSTDKLELLSGGVSDNVLVAVDELTSSLSNLILSKSTTISVGNVSANSTTGNLDRDISSSIPSGYKLLSATCENVDGTCVCIKCQLVSSTSIRLMFANQGSTAQNISPKIRLLLARSESADVTI